MNRHSRRDAFKFLGAGAVAAAALPGNAASDAILSPGAPEPRFFALADVRLGEGPFLRAQKLDEAYLLRLEPDRMLHNFRVNAGLDAQGARVRRLGIGGTVDRDPLPWPHARALS